MRPSKGALATSLAVTGLAFVTCAVAFTPAFVAGPYHRYLAWGPGDTQIEVTSRALAVARTSFAGPAGFILGSSGVREAISDSDELRGLLEQRSSRAPQVCPRCIAETLGEPFWAEHVSCMHAFAARTAILYWNLNERAELRNEDFYDYIHIFDPAAQQRFTLALSEALADLLAEERPG